MKDRKVEQENFNAEFSEWLSELHNYLLFVIYNKTYKYRSNKIGNGDACNKMLCNLCFIACMIYSVIVSFHCYSL